MLRVAYGLCLTTAILGMTDSAALAAGIGTVTEVVNEAFHTPPGGTEVPAKVNDSLVTDETLRTGENSTIAVLFVDGSELSVEAGSEVVLSDYVFDSQTTASSGVIELNNGLFHYDSNNTSDSGIVLQTPVATIGIRGTEFLVTVAKGITVVDIVEGEVEVMPRLGGKAARCVGGQSALVTLENLDAICGDFGSFSTAAGLPASPTTQVASGEAREHGGTAPENEKQDPPAKGHDPEPPGPPDNDGNRSGHGDGTNPGKGHDKGNGNGNHGSNNGGTDNPGGANH